MAMSTFGMGIGVGSALERASSPRSLEEEFKGLSVLSGGPPEKAASYRKGFSLLGSSSDFKQKPPTSSK